MIRFQTEVRCNGCNSSRFVMLPLDTIVKLMTPISGKKSETHFTIDDESRETWVLHGSNRVHCWQCHISEGENE